MSERFIKFPRSAVYVCCVTTSREVEREIIGGLLKQPDNCPSFLAPSSIYDIAIANSIWNSKSQVGWSLSPSVRMYVCPPVPAQCRHL